MQNIRCLLLGRDIKDSLDLDLEDASKVCPSNSHSLMNYLVQCPHYMSPGNAKWGIRWTLYRLLGQWSGTYNWSSFSFVVFIHLRKKLLRSWTGYTFNHKMNHGVEPHSLLQRGTKSNMQYSTSRESKNNRKSCRTDRNQGTKLN